MKRQKPFKSTGASLLLSRHNGPGTLAQLAEKGASKWGLYENIPIDNRLSEAMQLPPLTPATLRQMINPMFCWWPTGGNVVFQVANTKINVGKAQRPDGSWACGVAIYGQIYAIFGNKHPDGYDNPANYTATFLDVDKKRVKEMPKWAWG